MDSGRLAWMGGEELEVRRSLVRNSRLASSCCDAVPLVTRHRSSRGYTFLQAVALLGPWIGRVEQRYATCCPELLDLI
jgi:hypothetical protein